MRPHCEAEDRAVRENSKKRGVSGEGDASFLCKIRSYFSASGAVSSIQKRWRFTCLSGS